MKVLVTGGTGFLGAHLLRHLAGSGTHVRLLVHRRPADGAVDSALVQVVEGDVTDPAGVRTATQGVDAVVHLVAVIREKGAATFHKVNVEGTRNVVRCATEAGVKRFVHLSALGAGPAPEFRYTYSKWLAEEAVRSAGLCYVLLRPSVMFGEGFGFIDRVKQSALMLPFVLPVPGDGSMAFQPIWAGDVAACVVRALGDESFCGKALDIGGPEHLTYEQVLDQVMRVLGIAKRKIHVPLPLLRPAVAVMGRLLADPPVTSVELDQMGVTNTTALDSVERYFGFKPLPLCSGLGYIAR